MKRFLLSLSFVLASTQLLQSCGLPAADGQDASYYCKSAPVILDDEGKNRCYQPDVRRYDGILFSQGDAIRNCRILNNDSRDCREACDSTTSCSY